MLLSQATLKSDNLFVASTINSGEMLNKPLWSWMVMQHFAVRGVEHYKSHKVRIPPSRISGNKKRTVGNGEK
jgi:hypothetical protein